MRENLNKKGKKIKENFDSTRLLRQDFLIFPFGKEM